ncbi:MAG: circularly permuted type 2 ATP-grasp protein [Rhodospirillales bacterium]|nr:circularly permuted type 2 ATP-grasp protein [Rhodospirillales bacterium]MDE2198488.1 circularly permuted type 2 ATP-grasp protein [Rhodospirillales bacterium]MDE2576109.1 circularly permuted type 2 ATP-grasp protein [Rhodospirillales bacterium]
MTMLPALDEMVDGQGGLRPQWRGLLGAFAAFGEGGLAERARRLDRAFEDEGITSVLPGATPQANVWRCDPIPLLIPAADFAGLQAGLAQRARLLEAVLRDLHGPQSLLAEGRLPPALIFANPGFLRPCRGMTTGSLLHFYAADLVRGPDGAWRVLSDRTAGAGGIGYARENRRLLARVLPEAFRPLHVRPLRPFFDIWQDALQRLAPPGKTNPVVALLTPGTASAQWFEHMYLSRELSCALVEGGDLTVRGGGVFLKTLKGLQQVDVLLRRLDGRMIDPLELEAGSLLGVPGLLDAARAGEVQIANNPGAGLLEAPGLAAFLPALCMHLLGEKLALPSVPTLWLGSERAHATVRAAPENWLIRPALDGGAHAQAPATMAPAAREALLARVAAQPWQWSAATAIPPSVAPCLTAEGMTPRPVVLRVFMVFDGVSWQAAPGGLARVMEPHVAEAGGGASGVAAGRLPSGGVSKDVWVLSEDRGDIVGPAFAAQTRLRLRRTTGDLPSRVADNLFWLGRYVERLERAARLARAATARLGRGSSVMPHETAELQALGRCLVEAGVIPLEAAAAVTSTVMAEALLASVREGGSIGQLFSRVAQLTESVRDRLTGDMYATFTQTLRAARADAAAAGRSLDGLAHSMVGILRFSTAVAGVAAENMVRGGGWLFLDLGRRMERAQAVATEVAFAIDQPPPRIEIGLHLALELCDSAITYRSRYLNVLQPAPVLDLVLADQGNPRGLAFQLAQTHTLLDELAGEGGGARERLAATAAGLLAEIETLVEFVLAAPDQAVAAAQCPERLHDVSAGVAALSDRLTRRYFALLPAVQTLGMSAEAEALQGVA